MSINCVNNCVYQSDGQCNLNTLPAAAQTAYSIIETDCPYQNPVFSAMEDRTLTL